LISDLNSDIRSNVGAIAVADLSSFVFDQKENATLNSTITFPEFTILDSGGNLSSDQFATISLVDVIERRSGNSIKSKYILDQTTVGSPGFAPRFTLKTNSEDFVHLADTSTKDYQFTFRASANGQTQDFIKDFSLGNVAPFITGQLNNGNSFIPGDTDNYGAAAEGYINYNTFWNNAAPSTINGFSPRQGYNSVSNSPIEVFNFQKSSFYASSPSGSFNNNPSNVYPLFFAFLFDDNIGEVEFTNGSLSNINKYSEVEVLIKKIRFSYETSPIQNSLTYETTDSSEFVFQIINGNILDFNIPLMNQPQIGFYTITYVIRETFSGGLSSNEKTFKFRIL
jgi:hypothetical protein